MYGKHLEMVLKAAMSIASAFSYVSLLRCLTKSGVREKDSLFVQKILKVYCKSSNNVKVKCFELRYYLTMSSPTQSSIILTTK